MQAMAIDSSSSSSSSRLLFLFYVILFVRFVIPAVAQPVLLNQFCYTSGNFTSNSTYKSNLDSLLSSLSSDDTINYGFYNSSFGQSANRVNGIGLCRGDVKTDTCRSCINTASQVITQLCPNQKEAIVWYDECMLRYSNRSIFHKLEYRPAFWFYNVNNVSEINQFNETLETLLDNLTSEAASGDSLRKFATGNITTQNGQTIFALVQCTPDLSEKECTDCLANATGSIPWCCGGKQGGRAVGPSCHVRYEKELFYGISAEAPAPAPVPAPAPAHLTSPQVPSPAVPPLPAGAPPSSVASTIGKSSKIAGIVIANFFLMLL